MQTSRGLLIFETSVKPGAQQEFDAWYETEHLPERLACPGFLSGTRYRRLDAPNRYLAVYELASPAVLDSAAYRRIADPSAWTEAILPSLYDSQRAVYVECARQADLRDARSRYTGQR